MNQQLRQALVDQARDGATIAYAALAQRLGLKPPQTIHRLTQALEVLMEEDAAAGRPMLAALCTSKARPFLPAPGFFCKAELLGLYREDQDAHAFHAGELRRVLSFYGSG
jgi:hypothetical protein